MPVPVAVAVRVPGVAPVPIGPAAPVVAAVAVSLAVAVVIGRLLFRLARGRGRCRRGRRRRGGRRCRAGAGRRGVSGSVIVSLRLPSRLGMGRPRGLSRRADRCRGLRSLRSSDGGGRELARPHLAGRAGCRPGLRRRRRSRLHGGGGLAAGMVPLLRRKDSRPIEPWQVEERRGRRGDGPTLTSVPARGGRQSRRTDRPLER